MMRTTTLATLASVSLLAALAAGGARADEVSREAAPGAARSRTGLELGFRAGYGVPSGRLYDADNRALGDVLSGLVPLEFDLGYRITPAIYVGVYAELGFGIANSNSYPCNTGASCSGKQARLGFAAQYHLAPAKTFDPWIGLGFGYEGLSYQASGSPQGDFAGAVRGYELLNLQAGADFKLGPGLAAGPFLSFSLGKFDYTAETLKGASGMQVSARDIDNTALHEWLVFGLRGAYEL
jgi:opacity protein-like surface antigen